MAVPYSNITQNISTMAELIRKTNEVSAGDGGLYSNLLGFMLLLVITCVAFIALSRYGMRAALPATMVASYISSVFLAGGLGILPDYVPIIPLLGLAFSIAILFYEK